MGTARTEYSYRALVQRPFKKQKPPEASGGFFFEVIWSVWLHRKRMRRQDSELLRESFCGLFRDTAKFASRSFCVHHTFCRRFLSFAHVLAKSLFSCFFVARRDRCAKFLFESANRRHDSRVARVAFDALTGPFFCGLMVCQGFTSLKKLSNVFSSR